MVVYMDETMNSTLNLTANDSLFNTEVNTQADTPTLKRRFFLFVWNEVLPPYFSFVGSCYYWATLFLLLVFIKLLFQYVKEKVWPNTRDLDRFYFKSEIVNFYWFVINLYSGMFLVSGIILLLIQIPSTIQRSYQFIQRVIRQLKLTLLTILIALRNVFTPRSPSDSKHQVKNLDTFSNTVTTCIAKFLTPDNIINMARVNKTLRNKLYENLVWKNAIQDYYLPQLRKYNKESYLEEVNEKHTNTTNRLKAELLQAKIKELTIKDYQISEEERDRKIGYIKVLIEELFESVLRIPHTIFLPIKIASIPFDYISTYVLRPIAKVIINSPFWRTHLVPSLNEINISNNLEDQLPWLAFTNKVKEDAYLYNLQIIGFVCFLELLGSIALTIYFFISLPFTIAIRFLSLEFFSRPNILGFSGQMVTPTEKQNRLGSRVAAWNTILSVIIVGLSCFLLFIPSVLFKRAAMKIIYDAYTPTQGNFYIYLLQEMINRFFSLGVIRMVAVFFGPYFVNLLWFAFINGFYFFIKYNLSWSNILTMDYVFKIFSLQFLTEGHENRFFILLFPQAYVQSFILRPDPNMAGKFKYVSFAISALVACIPAYFIEAVIFKKIILWLYALANAVVVSLVTFSNPYLFSY